MPDDDKPKGGPIVSMEDLSTVLWRERDLLETLLFKLEVEQLVLASGRTNWLSRASREVESVLENLRDTELLRAVAADAAAASVGVPPNPSLRTLAEATEEPWRTILLDHRETFVSVVARVTEMAHANRDLLTSGYQAARDTLLSMSDGGGTYSADGSADTSNRRTQIVDRSI